MTFTPEAMATRATSTCMKAGNMLMTKSADAMRASRSELSFPDKANATPHTCPPTLASDAAKLKSPTWISHPSTSAWPSKCAMSDELLRPAPNTKITFRFVMAAR